MEKKGKYNKYIVSLVKFMEKNGFTKKPLPTIVLDRTKQKGILIKTGYYNPEKNEVVVFIDGRHPKDWLRSIAHELVHHKQNIEGRLGEGAYEGDRIVDDKKLVKLEEEAYLKGNIGFRSWTETIKKK